MRSIWRCDRAGGKAQQGGFTRRDSYGELFDGWMNAQGGRGATGGVLKARAVGRGGQRQQLQMKRTSPSKAPESFQVAPDREN
jgi:hypothetical protein